MTELKLWYEAPAREWTEALPIGNGRLGAMVFGGVPRERLQLNEDTLWTGGPYSQANPEARLHLDQVRALIFAGRYAEAEALADRHLMGRPLKQMSYQPAGDLWIERTSARLSAIAVNSTSILPWRPPHSVQVRQPSRAKCSRRPPTV